MRSAKPVSLMLGAIGVLGVAYLFFDVTDRSPWTGAEPGIRSTPEKPVDVVRMDGIRYTSQDGEAIRVRLKADRVEVARRKFGMLYVMPLQEAMLSNVEVEMYANGAGEAQDALSVETLDPLFPPDALKDLGMISRVRIDGLRVKVIRGQAVSSITARHATIDPRTRLTELTGGVLVEAADGRSIRSQSTTWDQAAGLFSISGPYLLMHTGRVVQGNGARFDAELRGVRS